MKTNNYNRYSYKELLAAATAGAKEFKQSNEFPERVYSVQRCTAISIADEENRECRQNALYVWHTEDSGEKVDWVVFNRPMPENMDDWDDMCGDPGDWEAASEEHHIIIPAGAGANQIDVDTLGAWLADYDPDSWNGEYYEADGLRLRPVYEWDAETDQGEVVHYEII